MADELRERVARFLGDYVVSRQLEDAGKRLRAMMADAQIDEHVCAEEPKEYCRSVCHPEIRRRWGVET